MGRPALRLCRAGSGADAGSADDDSDNDDAGSD